MSPTLQFPVELLLRAQGIRVVFFDVDGVLTDCGLFFTEYGETIKRFNTLDGHGLKLLQKAGITPAVITGRDSKPLRLRLEALGVTHVRYGTEDKRPAGGKREFNCPGDPSGARLRPWGMTGQTWP